MRDHSARQTTRPWYTGPAQGLGALALGVCLIACQGASGSRAPANDPNAADPAGTGLPAVAAPPPAMLAPGEEIELFDGSTLGMWKPESAGAGSAVEVAEGAMRLGWGNPGTAVAWTGTPIPESYEIALEVMRVEGSGSGYWFLTFPIDGSRACTLTLANAMGWLCGASGSPDDGAMTRNFGLDGGSWHSVRVRVVGGRVEASLDGEELVAEPSASSEGVLSADPAAESLEISTWAMTTAVRDIRLKRLADR